MANMRAAAISELVNSRWPHWPTGSLRYSLRMSEAELYRYHPKKYIERAETAPASE
jgi:hypothetical protein